jgi:hypothetical protein
MTNHAASNPRTPKGAETRMRNGHDAITLAAVAAAVCAAIAMAVFVTFLVVRMPH